MNKTKEVVCELKGKCSDYKKKCDTCQRRGEAPRSYYKPIAWMADYYYSVDDTKE